MTNLNELKLKQSIAVADDIEQLNSSLQKCVHTGSLSNVQLIDDVTDVSLTDVAQKLNDILSCLKESENI